MLTSEGRRAYIPLTSLARLTFLFWVFVQKPGRRLATAKSLWPNVEWVVVPKLSVDDGIAKGRAMFSRLWVDERNCAQWLHAISQYRQEWDENRGMFLEKPYHDSHQADEYRYAAIAEDQMTNAMPMPAPTTNLVKSFYSGLVCSSRLYFHPCE